MYRHDDQELFQLFDTFYMESVCELIREIRDPTPQGYRDEMADNLRTLLLPQIELFIHRLHESERGYNAVEFVAADSFRNCIENLAQGLELCEGASLDATTAREYADDLRRPWLEFIAMAGAYRMYDPKKIS